MAIEGSLHFWGKKTDEKCWFYGRMSWVSFAHTSKASFTLWMCFPLTKEARQTDPHTGCFNSLWHTLKTSEATVIQIENYATEIIGDLKWLSSKFFKFFGLKWIAEVLNFDDSMPKDTWFPLNFNFLKVEVGYFSWFN